MHLDERTGIVQLAAGQGACREMGAPRKGLRMMRCRHHYLFGLSREDAPTLILAILHEKVGLIARLGDPLGGRIKMQRRFYRSIDMQ